MISSRISIYDKKHSPDFWKIICDVPNIFYIFLQWTQCTDQLSLLSRKHCFVSWFLIIICLDFWQKIFSSSNTVFKRAANQLPPTIKKANSLESNPSEPPFSLFKKWKKNQGKKEHVTNSLSFLHNRASVTKIRPFYPSPTCHKKPD